MKFDFETIIDRKGKDSIAVDALVSSGMIPDGETKSGFDRISMWVADMNFATCPSVTEKLIERAQHPLFGYFKYSKEYFDTIINWHKERHGVTDLKASNIAYENGVLGGLVSALNVLCEKGGSVLLNTPAYVGFTATLANNGYNVVASELVKDADGIYRMDYEDMEKKIKQNKIHTAIFCSPHNPTGRVWSKEELEKAMDIFVRNDVYVICDEIWSDVILDGKHHPLYTISEEAKNRTVSLYAPSKTFNLAGLIGAYRIVFNQYLADRLKKADSLSHYNEMNVLSMHALIGAYSKDGMDWTDELCEVIKGNIDFACDFIKENFDGVKFSKPEGTYMLFLDCEEWCKAHGKTIDELQSAGVEYGVIWQDGRPFGGDYSIRMNLASPKSRIEEAFDRLKKYVFR